jgi:GGDEF domain-containing protein
LLQPKHWSLFLISHERQELYLGISQGSVAKKMREIRLKLGEGISGWVAEQGKPVLVPDVAYDKRFSPKADQITQFQTKSIICVPLQIRGEVLGVIELINAEEDREFSTRDMHFLLILADFAAVAIANARNYQKVERLSLKDPLTESYNIRHLHKVLDDWIEQKAFFSIIFLDLDYFKEVVDQHGHLVGSRLLQEFAKFLNQQMAAIPRQDADENSSQGASGPKPGTMCQHVFKAVRYGGDEFILLLKGINQKQARQFAQNLLDTLKEHPFSLSDKTRIHLSMSMGLGFFPETAGDKNQLMAKTDQAMFQAKDKGRGQFVVAH